MQKHFARSNTLLAGLLAVAAARLPAGAQVLPARDEPSAAAGETKSRVVIVRDPKALKFYAPQPDLVRQMVERGIVALTGAADVASAWANFAGSNDVVGIKINASPGPVMGTRRPVVDAVVAGLRAAGVPANRIVIWDRSAEELVAAGWEIRREGPGPLCTATLPYVGWDPTAFYQTPHPGTIIWGDHEFGERQISERSYFSRILSRMITRLINVPVLMEHKRIGINGCLYNVSVSAVDNHRRFVSEDFHFDPGVAEMCARPPVRDKLVLNILDALVAQYAGGPKFQPEASWTPGEIYLSRDPVALDALGLEAMETQRKAAGIRPLGGSARHVRIAADLKVGVTDRAKMDIVEINP